MRSGFFLLNTLEMKKIEHLGIAVKDLKKSNEIFSKLLNTAPYKEEAVESEGVTTSFFQVGDSKIELLQATRSDSPIAKFIEKKGEGIHHVAFNVEDIEKEIERLQEEGFELIHKQAKPGADNMLIAFLHPKSTNGMLVEICQQIVD
ncbi:Ethylmalonyl-CoA/methylmalonyl-CoA epimerase [Parvicella tangerina]|uniref:Ethylmalonyl-CoA/methylmalonyl-CoA epimerase n=2 Tax=Parvicella tangerina TaxID=2829795 RepID=A0A916JQ38_9FLAO|nr:Ethylmalonyl-CoA/methylmalonyl-CoA epimerase [Parvicella tangerina]